MCDSYKKKSIIKHNSNRPLLAMYKGNKWKNKGGNNKQQQQGMQPNQQIQNQFQILISNFPLNRSPDVIVNALCLLVQRACGGRPKILQQAVLQDRIIISVLNQIQMDFTLQMNGSFICNNPIWLIKAPLEFEFMTNCLTSIFHANCEDGQVDLSDLRTKVGMYGGIPNIVNFNNRDFVEFLLFRLGTDSRDQRFYVGSLILSYNAIPSVDMWSPFFHFLPNLRTLILNFNCLSAPPYLPQWPYIEIVCSPQTQTKMPANNNQKQNKNQGGWGQQDQQQQGGWGQQNQQAQGGWGQNQQIPNGWSQQPQQQNQGGWGQAQQSNQGGWGQQSQQEQGGWGQQSNQNGWGQQSNQGGWGQQVQQQNQGGWGQAQQDQNDWDQNNQQSQGGWGQQQSSYYDQNSDWNQTSPGDDWNNGGDVGGANIPESGIIDLGPPDENSLRLLDSLNYQTPIT